MIHLNCLSSVVKKYIMALTGLVLTGFVFFHMLGNLQVFLCPSKINIYAHFLKTLPLLILWGGRLFLFFSAAIHAYMGILLTIENKRARPDVYLNQRILQASIGSKTMGITGSVILLFIIFHLLHFTIQCIHPEYKTTSFQTIINGKQMLDVYRMVLHGFSYTWVSLFYMVAMGCLGVHLSHGVSSCFQSLGLRSNKWKGLFDKVAWMYAWMVFLGFSSIPFCVMVSKYTHLKIFSL